MARLGTPGIDQKGNMMSDPVNEFLRESSSGRYPNAKFEKVGDGVSGTIVGLPKVIDTEHGKRLIVDLDDGQGSGTTLWVRPGAMAQAVHEAVGDDGMSEGGKLAVVHSGTKDTGKPQPVKLYEARYEAPRASVDVADIFSGFGEGNG
jgi:hypothetical protein